jgi:hypothetical protein
MLKFLLIVFLFFLAIYYLFILPFKPKNDLEDKHSNRKRAKDSNVDIDFVPEDKKQGRTDKFKGGEYIDYEEVN